MTTITRGRGKRAVDAGGERSGRERPATPGDYELTIRRAFSSVERHAEELDAERLGAALEIDSLLREAEHDRRGGGEARGLRGWVRCEALLARSRELRHRDPQAMVLLAVLATALSETLAPEPYGAEARADLQARCRAELGNARRVAGDPDGAELELHRALARSGDGSGDPALLVRMADLTASLFMARRRFDEAAQLLEALFDLHTRMGDRHAAGRVLVKRGLLAMQSLQPERAVRILAAALERIDPGADPRLTVAAIHNLLMSLVEGGEIEQAARLLWRYRPLISARGDVLSQVSLRWLEGRIAGGQGDVGRAAKALSEVRDVYLEKGMAANAAVVSLDLAALHLEQGRALEARHLVEEVLITFRALHIGRESLASLLLLHEALVQERATVVLLRTVASELQRSDLSSSPRP